MKKPARKAQPEPKAEQKKGPAEKRIQDDSVRIRMMADEHQLMDRAAQRAGLRLAAWARSTLLRVAREELGEDRPKI